ncbi:hypothetical protein [Nocardioides dilutus]
MAAVRGSGARALQWLGLLLLAAVTVALCYLALTRETAADSELAQDTSPSASDTPTSTDQPTPTGEPTAAGDVKVPKVPDQRLADFTKGDDLPDGSVVYDSPGNATGMKATAKGLTHGSVDIAGAGGLGLVETELKSAVRSLGFRVRFAKDEPGSAVLAAWESSAVVALEEDAGDLPSGMRFVATPGTWSLAFMSAGGRQVLAEGTFDPAAGPLEFRVVRDGDELFVVDPTGLVTTATKSRADELLGPFASWGLIESGPTQAPAVIEAVWAG